MWIEDIQTQFVRDRVQETSFADRRYIYDLYLIEQLQSGRSFGMAFHLGGGDQKLYTRYPAESESIRLEIQEGYYVDPRRFTIEHRQLTDAWIAREKAQVAARRHAAVRERAAHQAEEATRVQLERDAWQQMGGAS